jgi:hypothetical protein
MYVATLMNLLSGTTESGYYSGDILIDNAVQGANLKAVVAHVECFDFHIEEFTVLQNLYFAARLRVGRDMTYDQCIEVCREAAETMHLLPVLDVIVGSDLHKGISGRLCYAVLCYAMLCMLCYAMLYYAMLCYAVLCYAMLCCAMLCYAVLCYAMLCCDILCYAMLCYDMLRYDMIC